MYLAGFKLLSKMRKNHFFNLIFLFMLISYLGLNAQDISGSITYEGVVNQKFVDSFIVAYKKKDKPMSLKKDIINAMKNAKKERFVLNFKNNESYYYHVPALEAQNHLMGSRAGTTPYYTDNKKALIVQLSSSLGKINKQPVDWKITNKTKQIGNYRCKQAITKEKLYSRQGHFYYKDIVAWFSPKIPISFGPKNYKGLPGLILQIEDKEYTLTAVKINLNPEKDVEIKRIDEKDKLISEKESFKRIEEMMKDYNKG